VYVARLVVQWLHTSGAGDLARCMAAAESAAAKEQRQEESDYRRAGLCSHMPCASLYLVGG